MRTIGMTNLLKNAGTNECIILLSLGIFLCIESIWKSGFFDSVEKKMEEEKKDNRLNTLQLLLGMMMILNSFQMILGGR